MENIIYRTAKEQDAEKVVEFFNMVGGETTYMSFEKDEYALDVKEQAELSKVLKAKKRIQCYWRWMERRLQVFQRLLPVIRLNQDTSQN